VNNNSRAENDDMQLLELLMKTSASLLTGRNLTDVLSTLLHGIKAVGFDRIRLYLLSKDKKYMVGKAHIGMDESFIGFQMPIAGDSLLEKLVANPDLTPQKMVRQHNKSFRYDKELARQGVNEWVYLPLIWNGEAIGLLVADNKFNKRPIADEIFDPLAIFTAQAAAAIANVQYAQQLKTVQQMALEMTSEWDSDQLLQKIIQQATNLIGAKSGGIYEHDPENKLLTIVADYNRPENLKGATLRSDEGMAGWLIKNNLPYFTVADYDNSPYRASIYQDKRLFGAVIEVLLKWQECIVGVLYVDDEVGRHFTERDAELLQLLAVHAAAAIKSAEQKAETEVQKERFQELVESAPEAIIANNREGIITFFNREAEKILGFKAEDVINKKRVIDIFAVPEVARKIGELLDQSPPRIVDYKTWLENEKGQTVPIRLSATRIYNNRGQHIETVGHFVDLRKIQAQERDLPLLLDASNSLASAETLFEGLQELAEKLVSRFGSSFCRFFLLEEREEPYLTLKAVYPPKQLGSGLTWQPGLDQSTRVSDWPNLDKLLQSGKPRLLEIHNDLSTEILKKWSELVGLSQDIRSLLVVPIRTQKKVVGLLDLGDLHAGEQSPFEDVKTLVTAIAQQTAVLIDRFHLYETTGMAQSMLQASHNASNALLSSQDPEEISSMIVGESAGKMAGATGVRMLSFDPVTNQFTDYARPDNPFEPVREFGFTQQVFSTGQIVKLRDVDNIEGEIQPSPTFAERGIKAAIGLPLSVEEKIIGVIWFYYDKPRNFFDWEVEALQLYANQAAMAYEHARQIKELKHLGQASYELTGATHVQEALDLIVKTGNEVLKGDSAVFWAYDHQRGQFILENSVAYNIPDKQWQTFLKAEPRLRGRVKSIMEDKWVGVPDVSVAVGDAILGEATRTRLLSIGVNSFQGVALRAGGEKFGILYVNYKQPRNFSKEDRERALTFATHAAMALKTAKLVEQINKAQASARTIAKVTTSVNQLEEMLHQIAVEMKEALGCDVVTLHIYEPDKQKLIYPAVSIGVNYPEKIPPPGNKNLAPPLLETFLQAKDRKTYPIENVANDARFQNSRFSKDEGIASCMVIRLMVNTEIVGVIFLSYRTAHHFTQDEEKSVELFADQAAIAIRNAQLLERSNKHAKTLNALIKAGQAVTSSLDLTETLNEIAKEAYQVAKAKNSARQDIYISIWLAAPNSTVVVEAAYPSEELEITRGAFPEGIYLNEPNQKFGIVGLAIRTQKTQVIADVSGNPHYLRSHPGTISEMAIPIMLEENKAIGAINLELPDISAFDQEDEEIFQSLADLAAVAIDKARQYEELKEAYKRVKARTAVAVLGLASSRWTHATHTDVQVILETSERLRKELDQFLQQKRAHKIYKFLSLIDRLCNEILHKPSIQPLSLDEETVLINVNEQIRTRVQRLWKSERYQKVEYELTQESSNLVKVKANPDWLEWAFDVLVDNAVKAVNTLTEGAERQVTIGTRTQGNGVEIFVADTGPGFPESIRGKIGQEPIEKSTTEGMGVGLLLAGIIVETYRGKLYEDRTARKGAKMVIWLPYHTA
jgi:PAS domain S-box-containing protein